MKLLGNENLIGRKELGPCTIYLKGEFFSNIHRIECKAAEVGFGKYAQYGNAASIAWIEKGKRKARGTTLTYNPWGLILEGHGHPVPAGMFGAEKTEIIDGEPVKTSQSSYMSCSDGYANDFDSMIAAYLEDKPDAILVDLRGHNSHDSYANKPMAVGA